MKDVWMIRVCALGCLFAAWVAWADRSDTWVIALLITIALVLTVCASVLRYWFVKENEP